TSSRSSMNTSRTSSTSPATGRPPMRSCSRTSWATPKFLSKEALTELIAATGGHIRLIVFNPCFSRNQVEAVVQHVKAVIGGRHLDGERCGPVLRRRLLRGDRLRPLGC